MLRDDVMNGKYPTHGVIVNPLQISNTKKKKMEAGMLRGQVQEIDPRAWQVIDGEQVQVRNRPEPVEEENWRCEIVSLHSSRESAELAARNYCDGGTYKYGYVIVELQDLIIPMVNVEKVNLVKPKEKTTVEAPPRELFSEEDRNLLQEYVAAED
jgi:hypothetical protein